MNRSAAAVLVVAAGIAVVVSLPVASGGPRPVRLTRAQVADALDRVPSEGIEAFFVGGPIRPRPGDWTSADERFSDLAAEASSSIDVAAYTLGRESVTETLLAAHNGGVRVRVVADVSPDRGGPPGWLPLWRAGIPVVTDTLSSVHHNKFAVFDRRVTWTGSANFTDSGFASQSNNVLVITSTAVADVFTSEFDEMFKESFDCSGAMHSCNWADAGGARVELAFGPCDCMRRQIEAAIASADESLYVAMNNFSDREIADALIAEHLSGVDVVVVLDEGRIQDSYSVSNTLRVNGISVIAEDFDGALHDKFAVVDAGTRSDPLVVTGSPNWSNAGMERNDENSLVIHSGRIAQQYCQRFADLALTAHPDIGVRCASSSWLPLALHSSSPALP